jgi:hypothetical protein
LDPRPIRLVAALAVVLAALAAAGCRASIPDPKDAVRAYADAAARGDARALYAMLSAEGRRALSPAEVERRVADERGELSDAARALSAPGVVVKARASVRWADGETAALELVGGRFEVSAADALPAGAKTPVEALGALRRVLARRSYAGLLRLLSPPTRSAIEGDLRSLVEGLERPEGLDVHVAGDVATVQIPGGHEVKLRREAGVWHVEDFD